ncbi:tRNA nucleotidyltransferase [Geomicrobium sp. JCM 19039]|nr:tRNA nucleotidyltransferase [Geomicrobium sp. JCM 19039]
MMRHDIGRIPVIEDEKLIGIISRSDLLSALYDAKKSKNVNVSERLNQMLGPARTQFLQHLGKVADEEQVNVYLVGGIVRDVFLDIRNFDLDFVVEGDAMDFAKKLAHKFQAPVHEHEAFQTAKVFMNDEWIDFASARAEYYDAPSSLPKVRRTSLKEDLGSVILLLMH